jgi:hypothetical protein
MKNQPNKDNYYSINQNQFNEEKKYKFCSRTHKYYSQTKVFFLKKTKCKLNNPSYNR